MKQRPILFNSAMVRAILSGQKTQTRRVVKPHRSDDAFCLQDFNDGKGWWPYRSEDGESPFMDGNEYPLSCPFGSAGDQLWVRETWSHDAPSTEECRASFEDALGGIGFGPYYLATETAPETLRWIPSIHMPRWASRITLEITKIRVERLHDISEEDAIAEGAQWSACCAPQEGSVKAGFAQIWHSTGGDWDANSWVWVVEFKRVTA